MSVTVDRQPLAAQEMGLPTLGQLLAHLQKENRLVVHVLVDGQEPDLTEMGSLRRIPLDRHTLFVETADPRDLALQALAEVEAQLDEADQLRAQASDLILANQQQQAMQKLSGCFATWQTAPESVLKTAQILRVDLEQVRVAGKPLADGVRLFAEQLRHIKEALENRDFVALNDILTYEAPETTAHWRAAIEALRAAFNAIH